MKKLLLLVMAVVLVGCESPRVDKASAEMSQAALERQKQRELAIAKDRRERARTPRPSISNNYNGSRADLIKLFMTGDPKAAWVLGERTPNKIEKYKWWTLATLVSQTKNQGSYRPQEAARLKASITSPADRQNFANWQQNIAPTVTIISAGKGVAAWLSELQRKNLLPH